MTPVRKAAVALAMVGSTLTGGAIGAYLFGGGAASAATTTTTPAASSSTNNAPPPGYSAPSATPGTFHSNENPAHEATESAAREAQENAGQVPTVP